MRYLVGFRRGKSVEDLNEGDRCYSSLTAFIRANSVAKVVGHEDQAKLVVVSADAVEIKVLSKLVRRACHVEPDQRGKVFDTVSAKPFAG